MEAFFDIHCHLLCGVDDGAKSEEEMYAMLDAAYADGTRAICLTPHFSPYLFGDTSRTSEERFAQLCAYAKEKYPDLQLYLGHELGYYSSCVNALNSGTCRTLNGSRYLLVDFPEAVSAFEIENAVGSLQRMGYHTVLAHTERYRGLAHRMKWIREYVEAGGLVQVNAGSAQGQWGRFAQKRWKQLVREGLVHFVASDAHNLTSRPPVISGCLPLLEKFCDEKTVRAVTWENACKVMRDEPV